MWRWLVPINVAVRGRGLQGLLPSSLGMLSLDHGPNPNPMGGEEEKEEEEKEKEEQEEAGSLGSLCPAQSFLSPSESCLSGSPSG